MKLIGLLISLAILGYAASVYLDSSSMPTDDTHSKPKDYIDEAKKSADMLNQSLQKDKERLDNTN